MKYEKKVAVGMPQELYDRLKECRSVPSYIRLILWEHVKKM